MSLFCAGHTEHYPGRCRGEPCSKVKAEKQAGTALLRTRVLFLELVTKVEIKESP